MIRDDPRWDRELLDALRAQEVAEAPQGPLDAQRRAADAAALVERAGGDAMAETRERWVLAGGRRVLVRVHRPRVEEALPVLVFLHGGGWVFGSLDTHDRLMRALAAAGDVAVVGVDYALAPEAAFPRAAVECAAVVRRVAAEAAGWGLDPARMVLGGDSAGANLAFAASMLLRDGAAGADEAMDAAWAAVRGVLAIYPVCDAAMADATYAEFATGYGLEAAGMAWFWERYAAEAGARESPLASVGLAALGGLPPVLVLAAELDVLRGEGEAMAARLREAGVEVRHAVSAGAPHGFLASMTGAARAREALSVAGGWLRARCR